MIKQGGNIYQVRIHITRLRKINDSEGNSKKVYNEHKGEDEAQELNEEESEQEEKDDDYNYIQLRRVSEGR